MTKGIVWADSAARHGINRLDVIHAIVNHYHHVPRFDDPRVPGGIRPDLYRPVPTSNSGPPRQLGGPLLKVMLEVHTNGSLIIFHAMEARAKMLALFD
ncbi:MAG: hypothetical protein ACYCV4_10245 [Dermatophilaceae bacterium]